MRASPIAIFEILNLLFTSIESYSNINFSRQNEVDMKHTYILLVPTVFLGGCGSYLLEDKNNPVSQAYVSSSGVATPVVSVLNTIGSRRIIVVDADKNSNSIGDFCAEPPPDAMESLSKAVAAQLEASVKVPETPLEVSGAGAYASNLARAMAAMPVRYSQGYYLLRQSGFQMCNDLMNGVYNEQTYAEESKRRFDEAVELTAKEIATPAWTEYLKTGSPAVTINAPELKELKLPDQM